MILLLFLATCFLAYSNGANDNFKGVASLLGSRTTAYRTAIGWATITTFSGSIVSIFLAQTLLTKFSGKGLISEQIAGSERFLLAVALGTGVTIIVATLTGFPVSTTHGLTGAMIGCGLASAGAPVNWAWLGRGFVLPLVLSPVLAVVLAALIYLLLHALPRTEERPGLPSHGVRDMAHFVSAGVVSFARGLNDTPKIAALLVIVKALNIRWGFTAVAVAMAVGGLLNAKKVAETMSFKITSMDHSQAFAANLSTGVLVILASTYGLPVSTTHVSVGSLFGIGVIARKVNMIVVVGILLSWVFTLPCAALAASLVFRFATWL
jgi:inorganic phosphate transporter, PiT family